MALDFTLLYFFIPVFFIISITPGLCMTLALTMGITIGLRNTMKTLLVLLVIHSVHALNTENELADEIVKDVEKIIDEGWYH